MRGVRIPASKEKPAAMRRRPVQSRAYASSQALQEAFVRVLIEDGFKKTTVREVTAGAWAAIWAVYYQLGHRCAPAAACFHGPTKALAFRARTAGGAAAARPLLVIDRSAGHTP